MIREVLSGSKHGGRRTLYVSDLDQTLLLTDNTIGPKTVDLLNAAIGRGILFTNATVRPFNSSRRGTAALRLGLPAITYDGTITAHPDSGTPADIRLLPQEVTAAALAICAEHLGTEPVLHTFEPPDSRHHCVGEASWARVVSSPEDMRKWIDERGA